MSVAVARQRTIVAASPVRAVIVLGLREGRRMLTSPVYLVILLGLLITGLGSIRSSADVLRILGVLLVVGALATLFAVSLVATSARRTHADSQFEAAPLDAQLRTLATGLGVLLGPVVVASLLTVAMVTVDRVFDPVFVSEAGQAAQDVSLSAWEYVQFPLIWLGAGLLALALARWLPWPGVPLLAFVGLIVWTVWSANLVFSQGHAFGYLMPFTITSTDVLGLGASSTAGQLGWHVVYLFGLGLLALAAALLRHRRVREPAVLGFAALAGLLTVSAAWLQLP